MHRNLLFDCIYNNVALPQNSTNDPGINSGPSVGAEDSKFLMESSLNQNSISMRQESKFSARIAEKPGQASPSP